MQQAEHITESEVDIEKKKQELYSEIDALGIKSDSRINKLKKFLADRKIWHLEEMDYPLRNSYEQYLRGQIRSQIVSFYLKIYDTVKQQHIYQQMQTLNGKRIYEWKYQNKIYFLKYYPEKEIAETFETSYKTNLLVWDFTQNCSEVLKKQIFYTLSRIIANTSMSKAYRNVRLKSLKLLYDSCVQLNITDIGLLEMEQVETILKNFPETSQRSILGECRRDAFMQQEQIQWEANVWYLERLHLGKHRIDESKSLISISFMEVKEIQNREILQAYMKYELGITGQAVSTIVRRFVCIRNFIELLEQEKILAIHATVAEVKKYADGLRERGIQAKGFNERIFGIGHFYKFMEVKQYITRMPFRIEYFQQKEVIVHHDRSVEETVYMEILKKLYLFPERLRCMFLHLWCLGLRASEVCTLKGNAYYQQGEHLFINTDIPPEVNAEFRVYSDDEMKRLNAEITQMDVQIARCLLIHQMLGTRISDTLTLRPDCLTRENGQDMIEIYQVKTKRYKKPISKELAKLLQSSIEYTQEKFGDTEYIFVNEKEPDRPMQYMAIKTKVMSMIQEKQLKDDHGELFGFGTHMFRHYYGVKLTEMHLDDWTIARLLGHKRLNNVQHYRKMSNQRMADETREVRQRMSDIIYMSLARWGEEYEQIRQDD